MTLTILAATLALNGHMAKAGCDQRAPQTGRSVQCDATSPNPDPQPVVGQAGASDVGLVIEKGAAIVHDGGPAIAASGGGWSIVMAPQARAATSGDTATAALEFSGVSGDPPSVQLYPQAEIASSGSAIRSANGLNLSNHGSMSGEQGGAIVIAGGAKISNRGQLTASGADARALQLAGPSQVTNYVAGAIDGAFRGIEIDGEATILNQGQITGRNAAIVVENGGAQVNNGRDASIDATGSVIVLSDAGDSVENAGLLRDEKEQEGAAVAMGGGDDSLLLHATGQVKGVLDGSAGNDVLRLSGSGARPLDARVQGFESIDVASGQWAIKDFQPGAATFAVAVAGDGALTLGTVSGRSTLVKTGKGTLGVDPSLSAPALKIEAGTLEFGEGSHGDKLSIDSIENQGALVFARTSPTLVHATITGAGTLEQRGPGTLFVQGALAHTGATTVSRGDLSIHGDITRSDITVKTGGYLSGEGRIAGKVSLAGGALTTAGFTVGALDMSDGELLYAPGTAGVSQSNGWLVVEGDAVLDGRISLIKDAAATPGRYVVAKIGGRAVDRGLRVGQIPDGADPRDFSVRVVGNDVVLCIDPGSGCSAP